MICLCMNTYRRREVPALYDTFYIPVLIVPEVSICFWNLLVVPCYRRFLLGRGAARRSRSISPNRSQEQDLGFDTETTYHMAYQVRSDEMVPIEVESGTTDSS